MRLDHLQLAIPAGREDEARAFFGDLLGLAEVPKPERLQATGGCWFEIEDASLHLGIDPDFRPQLKAHPGFTVPDVASLAERLSAAGYRVDWDERIAGVERFYTHDPFGNRIEFREDSDA